MALRKHVTLTVFSSDPYEFETADGQVRKGYRVQGFDDTDTVHSFTSQRPASEVHDIGGYDPERIQTFVLDGRIWDGKTKWREVEA